MQNRPPIPRIPGRIGRDALAAHPRRRVVLVLRVVYDRARAFVQAQAAHVGRHRRRHAGAAAVPPAHRAVPELVYRPHVSSGAAAAAAAAAAHGRELHGHVHVHPAHPAGRARVLWPARGPRVEGRRRRGPAARPRHLVGRAVAVVLLLMLVLLLVLLLVVVVRQPLGRHHGQLRGGAALAAAAAAAAVRVRRGRPGVVRARARAGPRGHAPLRRRRRRPRRHVAAAAGAGPRHGVAAVAAPARARPVGRAEQAPRLLLELLRRLLHRL